MKASYKCPFCDNNINIDENIVLIAKNKVGKRGLVFLHSDLGNYTSDFSDDFEVAEGDLLKLSCPICHQNLSNKKNDSLAHFIQVDEDGKEFKIVFSKVYGEKCTYKVEAQKVVKTYGEHLARYQNPDWFLLL